VTIAITYRCQVRCDHCYANSPNRPREDELTTEQIKSVIKQVKDLGALTVHFSGGEPLLRKDIFDLIVYARSLGLLTRVNTNGLLLNEENVKKLKAAGLTECGVSLDSADPDIHDRFRGAPGLFDKTVQGIRRLAEHKILIRVMTVAMKESIPEGVADTVALVRGLGARFVYILIPIASGSWKDSFDQLLNSRERAQLRALQDLKMAHLEMQTASTNCCVFRNAILYISANGNVTPCAFTPFVLGNVKEHPLSKIWRHHCADMKLECRGDCPLNIPAEREALRQHVSQVAEQLGGGRPSDPPRV
jgi:MoaA/NifB/PqqE/SkfB family radical SAM enzyme